MVQKIFSYLAILFYITGCATYQAKVSSSRELIVKSEFEKALDQLKPLAETENRDQLIYLLDYATTLQLSGQYKESARYFALSEKIADIQDYHSLSNVAASLVLSEEMVQYKGDDFEKVFINGINALNYLEMNDLDEALVEVRKLNLKLHKYKTEAKRNYEQNHFAFYLSACIWEADKKYDDAFIDYKKAFDLKPDFSHLKADLLRSAKLAERAEEFKALQSQFPDIKLTTLNFKKNQSEIIFVYQQGWGPRKYPRNESPRYPRLIAQTAETQQAELNVDGIISVKAEEIYNVTSVAIKTLDDDFGRLAASRVAGVVTKAIVSDQVRQKNSLLGDLAWIAMNVADRADLRQWSTLPNSLHIARVNVPPGKHKIKVQGLNSSGLPTGEVMTEREIFIKPGKKYFFSWRSLK